MCQRQRQRGAYRLNVAEDEEVEEDCEGRCQVVLSLGRILGLDGTALETHTQPMREVQLTKEGS